MAESHLCPNCGGQDTQQDSVVLYLWHCKGCFHCWPIYRRTPDEHHARSTEGSENA